MHTFADPLNTSMDSHTPDSSAYTQDRVSLYGPACGLLVNIHTSPTHNRLGKIQMVGSHSSQHQAQAVTHSICQWGASDLPVPPYLVLGTHIIPTSVVGCRDPPLLQQLRPRFHWLQQLPAQPEVPTAWTNSRGWHPVPHAR